MNAELREMIEARKAALSATWIDPEARYGRHVAQGPEKLPAVPDGFQVVEPVKRRAPSVTCSQSAKDRWAQEAAADSGICPQTGEAHRFRFSGVHHKTKARQKKCYDCRTTRLARPGDVVSGRIIA